jgi:heme oxygenase
MNISIDSSDGAELVRTLQTCLRNSTRAAHRDLDHHPLLAPLVRPDLSLDHYQYVLRVMNWLHVHFRERLISAIKQFAPASHFIPSDRPRWLADDFSWFGMVETASQEHFADRLSFRFTSAESVVGALYVLEGSTLGGQVIARQLAESIGVSPGQGASFFYGHGEQTQAHWKDFWSFAAGVCATGSIEMASASAVDMFNDFETFLNICARQRQQVVS